jgi:hypothetical protein
MITPAAAEHMELKIITAMAEPGVAIPNTQKKAATIAG